MTRSTTVRASARRKGSASAEDKVALAEALLVSSDLADCAQLALEWLGRVAGVTRALCLVVPIHDSTQLLPVASVGIPGARVNRFRLNLEERDHPLVRAMLGPGPVSFNTNNGPRAARPTTPLGDTSFVALPLLGLDAGQDLPAGLVLLSPPRDSASADVRWLAQLLGPRLAALRTSHGIADAERRLRQERSLLHSIINAVTDPILLTDTEGRILIANARAEALLASGEAESEGRRRAVALNNMLSAECTPSHWLRRRWQ